MSAVISSISKVKYAVIGAGSGMIRNIDPVTGAASVADLWDNQAALRSGAAKLYDTVAQAIDDICHVTDNLFLNIARVTITENPPRRQVLSEGELLEGTDKFAISVGRKYLNNTSSTLGRGYFAIGALDDAMLFDTQEDARLLLPTVGTFFNEVGAIKGVRSVPGTVEYKLEVLK